MRNKIIALIKKYRLESIENWGPKTHYSASAYNRAHSLAYYNIANDLEDLLNENEIEITERKLS